MDGKRKSRTGLRGKIALLLVVVFAMVQLVPMIIVADESNDSTTGKYSIVAAPEIDRIRVLNTSSEPISAMTPNSEYIIEVDVTAMDNFHALTNQAMVVKLWYDETGAEPSKEDFEDLGLNADESPVTFASIVYTNGEDDPALDAGDEPDDTADHWELKDSKVPSISEELDLTTFTFEYKIRIGKIAKEADGEPAKWHVAAFIEDEHGNTDYKHVEDGSHGLVLHWYGELNIDQDDVDFGSIPIGTTFGGIDTVSVQGIELLANGQYAYDITSENEWTASEGAITMERRFSESAMNDNFDNSFALGSYNSDAPGDADFVGSISEQAITIEDDKPGLTTYERNQVDNFLWIQLSDNIDTDRQGIEFEGSIIYTIKS